VGSEWLASSLCHEAGCHNSFCTHGRTRSPDSCTQHSHSLDARKAVPLTITLTTEDLLHVTGQGFRAWAEVVQGIQGLLSYEQARDDFDARLRCRAGHLVLVEYLAEYRKYRCGLAMSSNGCSS
jgi:hypothetical protein